MLQQVCEHIHNYFITTEIKGEFEISGSMVSSLSLLDGQRFLIEGSVLNDGVYTYHETGVTNDDDTGVAGLRSEAFTGKIAAMVVPPAVLSLVGEINSWVETYGSTVNSPFSSETVKGIYTYNKAVKSENAGGGSYSWQDVYKSRLNRWRKICL